MKTIRLAVAVLAFAACAAHAQKTCSTAESAAAEKALDRVVGWDQMYKTWKDYQHCDTALAEDNFTDAFMRLAVEWKNVDQFEKVYRADPLFKAFVHKHMRSMSAKDDLKSLYSRVKQSCPPKNDAFCAELAEVAKSAL
jgi:hypothetical protein